MEIDALIENEPLVSVGIPCYNRPKGLRHTLEQIINQTYKNIEIVISDNCSPDQFIGLVIREFAMKDNRIKHVRQPKNIGAYNNFKYVLNASKGKYFMWAADDDEWDPSFIEEGIKVINGTQFSIMPMSEVDVLTRKTQARRAVKLPPLSINNNSYQNACDFCTNIQPVLFYGIHFRETLLPLLKYNWSWDFFDIVLLLYVIINSNFTIINRPHLFTVGVDELEYEIKYADNDSKLKYRNAFIVPMKFICMSKKLSKKEKALLIIKWNTTIFRLYCHHEKNKNRFVDFFIVGCGKFFLRQINSIKKRLL